MSSLIGQIRKALTGPRSGRPICLVCSRGLSPSDTRLRLRGGVFVHRACATYEMRRRRVGGARLGYPPR